jgi:hypothetical protein
MRPRAVAPHDVTALPFQDQGQRTPFTRKRWSALKTAFDISYIGSTFRKEAALFFCLLTKIKK